MAFCGKCGAPLDGGKFCGKCGASVNSEQSKVIMNVVSNPGMKAGQWKKVLFGVAAVVVLLFVVTRFTPDDKKSGNRTTYVDEPCDWCKSRPSVAYKTSDGSYSYVCKDCSRECTWCGERATEHYENLIGMMVFVCEDCYED